MRYKQMQKRGERCSCHCRHGKCFAIVLLAAICLSGCGVQNAAKEALKSVEELRSVPDKDGKSPDIPYSDQIDIIIQNKDVWCFTVPADAEEEYGADASNYYYCIADMDQNGYLEVLSISIAANGCCFDNHYYELSQDGQSLTELETDEREEAPEPDFLLMEDISQGYYDEKTGIYHYPQMAHTHCSAVDTSDAQLDMVLADGRVAIDTISFVESERCYDEESAVVKYYAGDRAEKLGEIRKPFDETTEEFTHARKQESKCNKKLEELYEQYYEGMQEFTVTSCVFRCIDEKEYEKSNRIIVVSDKILRQRIEESWNNFGVHFPNEKAADNPFFPEAAAGDAEVNYLLNMLSEGKAKMQIQEELRGNDSILYLVTYCNPREVSNREGVVPEKEEKKWVKKQFKEFYFYLWVTDTQIYYIPRFYADEDDFSMDPDDDVSESDYQKARLVFYHEIPEYACLVCQEGEVQDTLEEGAEGEHQWIEKHGEDIRCYRSYTSRGKDYEGTNILQFVWKRGEGLIGVRYATHAAGGGGRFFWKEACLEQEDVGFSID